MDRADRILGVVIPLVVIMSIFGVTVSGFMLIMQPREVVSDVHQCSSTSRVVRVSVGSQDHHAVQVWGCVEGGCLYWTTATYETREQAMVHCHAGEGVKL